MRTEDTVTFQRLVVKETPKPEEPSFGFQSFFIIGIYELICGVYLERFFPEYDLIRICAIVFLATFVKFFLVYWWRYDAYFRKEKAYEFQVKKEFFFFHEETDILKTYLNLTDTDANDWEIVIQPDSWKEEGYMEYNLYCEVKVYFCGELIFEKKRTLFHYDPGFNRTIHIKARSMVNLRRLFDQNLSKVLIIKNK